MKPLDPTNAAPKKLTLMKDTLRRLDVPELLLAVGGRVAPSFDPRLC
jgi:hypothetical protein